MKKYLLVVLFFMLTACSSSSSLMVANTLARFDNYTLTIDRPYGTHTLNRLDVYRPKGKVKGTVVFFYGGCWGACTTFTKENYRFVAQALTSKGYIVVIPNYRLYPEVLFPQIMEDSAAVVTWVNNNIVHFGGKVKPIFLMGHSAGGHLAAMLTTNERYLGVEVHQNICGFIGLAAPYDFRLNRAYMRKLFANLPYSESQPSYFVDGGEPPLLLLYGKEDRTIHKHNIVYMTNVVQKRGGKVETRIYDGVDHVAILADFSIPYRNRFNIINDITFFLQNQGHIGCSQ